MTILKTKIKNHAIQIIGWDDKYEYTVCYKTTCEDEDKKPIVVLDDVMSELDETHQKRLIEFLRKFSQVFITGTELEIDGATHIQLNKAKEVF